MRAAVLILALGASACNGNPPTAPTPPPAPPVSPLPPSSSIVSIAVTGGTWIVTGGGPLQMNVRVYTGTNPNDYVDGTEHVAWSVEPASAGAVDRLGRLTATAPGSLAVIATVGDKTGRTTVRAVPDYTGNWSGEFIVTNCSGGFDFRECSRIMFDQGGLGSRIRYPMTLALSQEQDQVTGTLREIRSFGDLIIPVRGLVRLSGTLVLEASVPQPDHAALQILNWSSLATASNAAMSGAYTKIEPRRTGFGSPYALRVEQEFTSLAHAQ